MKNVPKKQNMSLDSMFAWHYHNCINKKHLANILSALPMHKNVSYSLNKSNLLYFVLFGKSLRLCWEGGCQMAKTKSSNNGKQEKKIVPVKPYVKEDGTKVKGHRRSTPN